MHISSIHISPGHISKIIAICLLGLIGSAGAASAIVELRGTATTERVSGTRNSDRVVTIGRPNAAAPLALRQIQWGERGNKPCYFKVRSANMTAVGLAELNIGLDEVDRCGSRGPTQRSMKENGYGTGSRYDYTRFTTQAVYITGMRVCLNNDRTRIKGIQTEGKTVSPSGLPVLRDLDDVDGAINSPYVQNQNCDGNWRRWSRCGRGKVAVAVDVHFGAGLLPRSASGIALRCKTVARPGALVRPD